MLGARLLSALVAASVCLVTLDAAIMLDEANRRLQYEAVHSTVAPPINATAPISTPATTPTPTRDFTPPATSRPTAGALNSLAPNNESRGGDFTFHMSGSDGSSMPSVASDAVAQRRVNSKLDLGSMAGIIAGCVLCIALMFAFIHRRKRVKKDTEKKRKPDMAAMNSTTANSTYFELPKANKGSRGGTEPVTLGTSGSVAASHKSTKGGRATSHPSDGNHPPLRTHKPLRSGQDPDRAPQPMRSAFLSTAVLSTGSRRPKEEPTTALTTIQLSPGQEGTSRSATDSNRSIAGVMKSYRQQPQGMFEDKSVRRTSLHTRRPIDGFEFSLDTCGQAGNATNGGPDVQADPTGCGTPITDAPLLARDSAKSVDEDDLHMTL